MGNETAYDTGAVTRVIVAAPDPAGSGARVAPARPLVGA
jgi:hypothetical protein